MSNIITTTNSKTTPLTNEMKPATVLDTPENLEGKDRAGWFDQDPVYKGFDAVNGSIDNFNADTVVPEPVISEIFGGAGDWITINPTNVVNKTASVVSKTANLVGNVAAAGADAGKDLFNQIIGTDQKAELQSQDPEKEQEKLQKEAEYAQNRQQGEDTEAKIFAIKRQLEQMVQLEEKRGNIAKLAGMNESFELVISGTGEVRTDLEPIIERKAEELRNAKEQQIRASLASPAKRGAKGPGMSMDDNKSSETHSTAQTATG